MSIEQFIFETREAEEARRCELHTRRERFEPPERITPVQPSLMDKLRERFEWKVRFTGGGGLVVTDRTTGEREVFIPSVEGHLSATCWMINRMKATP